MDEVPLPLNNSKRKNVENNNNNKNSDGKVSHNRSFSASGFFQSFRNPSEDKSSSELYSQSSAGIIGIHIDIWNDDAKNETFLLNVSGSAASLNEIGELSSIQKDNIKKSDSDIEVLSNPSQSSIEIIDGPTK